MDLYKEGDFNVDGLKNSKFSFQNMFEEIPIYVKNSNLTNVLMVSPAGVAQEGGANNALWDEIQIWCEIIALKYRLLA